MKVQPKHNQMVVAVISFIATIVACLYDLADKVVVASLFASNSSHP